VGTESAACRQVIWPQGSARMSAHLAQAVPVQLMLALPLFVWDGCSRRQVESALDVELDSPFALVERAADEVSRFELGVSGELEVTEPVVPPPGPAPRPRWRGSPPVGCGSSLSLAATWTRSPPAGTPPRPAWTTWGWPHSPTPCVMVRAAVAALTGAGVSTIGSPATTRPPPLR
jgi:hypothetical protein